MTKKIIDEFTSIPSTSLRYYYRHKTEISCRVKEARLRNLKEAHQKEASEREKNRTSIRKNNSNYKKRTPIRNMFWNAQQRAKKYNVVFNLKLEDIIIPEKCPILGIFLKHNEGVAKDDSPAVDRIVPEYGYIKSNIRVISQRANRYKSDLSRDQLQRLCDYVDRKI